MTDDLISRSALLEALKKCSMADEFADHGLNWEDLTLETIRAVKVQGAAIKRIINIAPAVDAELVRHGKWQKPHGMMPPEYHHRHACSICGNWALRDFCGRERLSLYCPNCGARMDEGVSGDGKAQD
mgnify:FL=1|nr:MAG TPA: hypothetical protein [Bacteriophage sp.]